jgi:SPP1 family predicted phage head-tail adaptor
MPEPRTGELNRQITIQQLSQSKDSEGGLVDNWSDFATDVWAKVRNISGNEISLIKQGGLAGVSRTEFTIRHIPGVVNTMRISYGGRFYGIKHVNNFNERNRFLVLDCETGKNTGH